MQSNRDKVLVRTKSLQGMMIREVKPPVYISYREKGPLEEKNREISVELSGLKTLQTFLSFVHAELSCYVITICVSNWLMALFYVLPYSGA